jgi:diacylglycerol kinase (ATP)
LKHLFIINPTAGKGKPLRLIPEIKRFFIQHAQEYNIEITKYPGHATEIACQYASKDKTRVYSVGGDGTFYEIVNGIIKSGNVNNCNLAIIPSGSGNDFFKSIPVDVPTKDLLYHTVYGETEPIDLAVVNGRYFANIASFGFDAEVVYNVQKIKKIPLIPAHLCYYAGIITTMCRYNNLHMKVSIDNQTIDAKFLLLAIANGKYYGGGILPAPEAVLDDGLFDVCLIHEKNFFEIVTTLPKYIKGQHRGLPGVGFYKAKEVKVTCDKEVALNIDGEIIKTQEAVFQIIPGGINLVVPQLGRFFGLEQVAASLLK